MRKDINASLDKCYTCAKNKGSVNRPAPIKSYSVSQKPRETVAIDFLKLPVTTEGRQFLWVAIDNFSRFSILIPLKMKTQNQ